MTRQTLAIVFTDIVGSRNMNRRLGDLEMSEVKAAHFKKLEELAHEHDVKIVKGGGGDDSLMAVFEDTASALKFGMAAYSSPGDERLTIYIGIHWGRVVVLTDPSDISGQNVNLAAGVLKCSEEGGVLVTEAAKDEYTQLYGEALADEIFQFRPIDKSLNGFSGSYRLYPIVKRKEDERPIESASKTGAAQDPLALIKEWLFNWQEKKGDNSDKEALPVTGLQKHFVEQKIDELCTDIKINREETIIITVRSAFSVGRAHLRPIYTSPEELHGTVKTPEKLPPFRFTIKEATESPLNGLMGKYMESGTMPKPGEIFAGLHKIRDSIGDGDQATKIASRIDMFFSERKKYIRIKNTNNPVYCIFWAIRSKDDAENIMSLRHIAAVFFQAEEKNISENSGNIGQILRKTANGSAKALFDGLDVISTIDANLFRTEGLELVAQLQPVFAHKNIAPAEKIAFAFEKLKHILKRHLISRRVGSDAPDIYYISTSFEPNSDGSYYTPRFRMYPHVYCRMHPVPAFCVSHRKEPSIAKALIAQYVVKNNHLLVVKGGSWVNQGEQQVNFDQTFLHQYPQSRNTESLHKHCGDRTDQVRLDCQDKELWSALQLDIDQGNPARSIVAFVIEGALYENENSNGTGNAAPLRQLPRGVLAIESQYIDAFSDDDVESLRLVATSFADLIRQITHENSSLDYRTQLEEAWATEPDVDKGSAWLLFSLLKLDGNIFCDLFSPVCRDDLDTSSLDKEKFPGSFIMRRADEDNFDFDQAIAVINLIYKNMTQNMATSHDRFINNEEDASKIMNRRKSVYDSIRDDIKRKPKNLKVFIEDTLDAIPENFIWTSYLVAITDALGDRTKKTPPSFSKFTTSGHSSTEILIASVQDEFRQIVKLSTYSRLKRECDNYLRHVRYKLPLAARISSNSFAFDSTGDRGHESGIKNEKTITYSISEREDDHPDIAYGALVSDLVSGDSAPINDKSEIQTLLSVTADCLRGRGESLLSREQIQRGIASHFDENLSLSRWRGISLSRWRGKRENTNVTKENIYESLRLTIFPADTSNDTVLQNDVRKLFYHHANFLRFAAKYSDGDYSNDINDQIVNTGKDWNIRRNSMIGIIHGDLNSKNLCWSQSIGRFVLIDFEHIMEYGVVIIDNFRLAINLVCDTAVMILESGSDAGDKYGKNWITEIIDTILFIYFISSSLRRRDCNFSTTEEDATSHGGKGQKISGRKNLWFHTIVEFSFDEFIKFRDNIDRSGEKYEAGDLQNIVYSIFYSADICCQTPQFEGRSMWLNFMEHALFCTAIKEHEYSCRMIFGVERYSDVKNSTSENPTLFDGLTENEKSTITDVNLVIDKIIESVDDGTYVVENELQDIVKKLQLLIESICNNNGKVLHIGDNKIPFSKDMRAKLSRYFISWFLVLLLAPNCPVKLPEDAPSSDLHTD